MKLADDIHRLKITFNVTDTIERFVYLYIIEGKDIHIIDAGVDGSEKIIAGYLSKIGRTLRDVKSILLTHSHPDHIGGAHALKEATHATVYASGAEREWMENIGKQFRERPIPNFHTLLTQSVHVDQIVKGGDILPLGEGITVKVIDSKGHSAGSLSFLWMETGKLFTGDAIPVIADIPIYESAEQSLETLRRLRDIKEASEYLPAWDEPYGDSEGKEMIQQSIALLDRINKAVKEATALSPHAEPEQIYAQVCDSLELNHLLQNPLFRRSVFSNIKEAKK